MSRVHVAIRATSLCTRMHASVPHSIAHGCTKALTRNSLEPSARIWRKNAPTATAAFRKWSSEPLIDRRWYAPEEDPDDRQRTRQINYLRPLFRFFPFSLFRPQSNVCLACDRIAVLGTAYMNYYSTIGLHMEHVDVPLDGLYSPTDDELGSPAPAASVCIRLAALSHLHRSATRPSRRTCQDWQRRERKKTPV